MRELIDKLNYYTKLYDEGKPQISDIEWDKLYFQLLHLEKESGYTYPDSPTQSISYQVVSELPEVVHSHPMLSLGKTHDVEDVNNFYPNEQKVIMLKMDGLTCSLRYEDGKLVQAETRGDGVKGQSVIHTARVIKNIPQTIPIKETVTVDGEVICDLKTFEENFSDEYSNARNFAAGSIQMLDSKECAERGLSFIAWDWIDGDKETLSDKLSTLSSFGFEVVPFEVFTDKQYTNEDLQQFKSIAASHHYPIDGLVVKVNNCALYKKGGATAHHPTCAIAYKYEDETYETYLQNIEWSLGKTGTLTPVAIFDEVEIDGAKVNRSTLHNVSIMKELLGRAYKGQSLQVCRANSVTPHIVSAGIPESSGDIAGIRLDTIPTTCPICGGPTIIEQKNDTEVLKCDNPDCCGQLLTKIDHYASKKGLDIKGLSRATIEKLIDWGWVNEIADLYTLAAHKEEWKKKEGFGAASVNNLITAIESSRNPKLSSFLCSLGIPLVGTTLSKQLAREFTDYDEFRKAVEDHYPFDHLEKVGIEKASAIWNFDYQYADRAAKYIKSFEPEEVMSDNQSLAGEKIVITGSLTHYKNRSELAKVIESHGGKVINSVSKNTTWLINNNPNSSSSKNVTAQKLGIPIITEEEFINQFNL